MVTQIGNDYATDELLNLLLYGYVTDRSRRAGRRLIDGFETLRALGAATVPEIITRAGLTQRDATKVLVAFEIARRYAETRLTPGARLGGSADVFRHYHLRLRDEKREHFMALMLDGKHHLAGEALISTGTLTASLVHPRESFKPAIAMSAAAIIFVHNHPSGDPKPSREDMDLTRRLVSVGDLVGIRVLDHVIIGDGKYHSFADAGAIRTPQDVSGDLKLAAGL